MHCLHCGNKLETVNYTETCTKYLCHKCNCEWFQSRRIVVEWTKKKLSTTQNEKSKENDF